MLIPGLYTFLICLLVHKGGQNIELGYLVSGVFLGSCLGKGFLQL